MTIILDLDDTLVDTSGFKEALFHCLSHHGVSRAEFATAYARLRKRHDFSVEGLYEFLPHESRPTYREYEEGIRRVLAHYPFRIYPDVRWFLARCRGHRRVLYTYGNELVQNLKVRSLKLRPLFHQVVITNDPTKLRDLPTIAAVSMPAVLIDNDSVFIERAGKAFPNIRPFCITRRRLSTVGAYPDLQSIYHILKKQRLLSL